MVSDNSPKFLIRRKASEVATCSTRSTLVRVLTLQRFQFEVIGLTSNNLVRLVFAADAVHGMCPAAEVRFGQLRVLVSPDTPEGAVCPARGRPATSAERPTLTV